MTFFGSKEQSHVSGTSSESLTSRIARSVFWVVWSRGVIQIFSFLTTLLIAHILEPSDYGVVAIAGIWTTAVGMVAEMGLGSALIQFRDLGREEIDTCFWLTFGLAVTGYSFLCLMASSIAEWFDVSRLSDVLPVLGLVLPITAFRVISDSLLRKHLQFHRLSQAEMVGSVVTLPIMLVCALAHMGVWTLVIGGVALPAIRTALTFYFAPWVPRFKLGGARAGELIRFSLSTLGVKVFWVLREDSDVFLLGKLSGDVIVGIYSMAKKLAALPTSRISGVMNLLSSPIMAELQESIDKMRVTFYRALRLTAALAFPACAGVALTADHFVVLLLGPKWLAAIPILRLLCVYTAVRAIDVLLPPVLFARRRERFLYWYCLGLLIVLPAASLLGALWNGAAGLVIFFTPVYCFCMTLMAREALLELRSGFFELFSEIWPSATATAIMALVVGIARYSGIGDNSGSFVDLSVLVVSGFVSYLAVLLMLGGPVVTDGVQLFRWFIHGHRISSTS